MKKSETLAKWKELPQDVNPLRHMNPIPYKTRGSRYGTCGIRIDGTPAFVDAVLGKLKELLDGENAITRLELSRSPVDSVTIKDQTKYFENAGYDAEVCYIRLHERGGEAARMNFAYCADLRETTLRFAETKGIKV
jgi:hypothetical protein